MRCGRVQFGHNSSGYWAGSIETKVECCRQEKRCDLQVNPQLRQTVASISQKVACLIDTPTHFGVCLPWRCEIYRQSYISKDIVQLYLHCHRLVTSCLLFLFLYLFIESFPSTQHRNLSWIQFGNSIPTEQLPTRLLKGHHSPLLYLQACVFSGITAPK